jgi:hypothetical protein
MRISIAGEGSIWNIRNAEFKDEGDGKIYSTPGRWEVREVQEVIFTKPIRHKDNGRGES